MTTNTKTIKEVLESITLKLKSFKYGGVRASETSYVSTDAHVMLVLDKSVGDLHIDTALDFNIESVIPETINPVSTRVGTLLNQMTAPLVDEMIEDEEGVKCDECDGTGIVEFEYSCSKGYFEIESDCPVCEGDGSVYKDAVASGKKIHDAGFRYKILNAYFLDGVLRKGLSALEKLGVDAIVISNKSHNVSLKIEFPNGVMIIMPCLQSGEDTFKNIEL